MVFLVKQNPPHLWNNEILAREYMINEIINSIINSQKKLKLRSVR